MLAEAFMIGLSEWMGREAAHDLVYGACFHDWVALASRARETGWLAGFLAYARAREVEVTTYTDYWRRCTGEGG